MERNRLYNRDHPHRESRESRKKSNQKYRISSYGLTQEQYDRLLDARLHTCGMCHEPFAEGLLIHMDHDHACCRRKIPYLQHRARLHRTPICDARADLDSPPVRLLDAAYVSGAMPGGF